MRPHLESGDVICNQPGNYYEGDLKKNYQQLAWNHSMVEDGKGTCLSCVSFKLHTFEIYFFSASQNSHLCDAEKIISKIHFYLMLREN